MDVIADRSVKTILNGQRGVAKNGLIAGGAISGSWRSSETRFGLESGIFPATPVLWGHSSSVMSITGCAYPVSDLAASKSLMSEMSQIRQQAGVIAYRVLHDELRVLLITSRDTGRWIIPKGNIGEDATPAEAAEKEAFEEAGIKGTFVGSVPLGFYTYFKRLDFGETLPATVAVYPLHVTKQFKKWPEKGERKLAWVSLEEAIELIDDAGLIPLLSRLAEVQKLHVEKRRRV